MDRKMGGQVDGWMSGWVDEWTGRWMSRWEGKWRNGKSRTFIVCHSNDYSSH